MLIGWKSFLLTLSLLVLATILASGSALAQTSVQVPVDTTKAVSQLPVATTFKAADGVWWSVSGTLTLKPIPAPVGSVELPPLPPLPLAHGFREGHLPGWGYGNTSQWSTLALAIANREPWSWLSGEDVTR